MGIVHIFKSKDGTKTKELTPLKAIREKCLECSSYSWREVENCPIGTCALYPFRLGKTSYIKRKRKNKMG
jgi:hypothetical protein